MMIFAPYLRPWVTMVKSKGVVSRVLTDAMRVLTHGGNNQVIHEQSVNDTHQYLNDIGSAIAPEIKHGDILFLQAGKRMVQNAQVIHY